MRDRLRDPSVVHARRWWTLLCLCLSLMVIGLDNTILNVALPTLAKPVADGGLDASGSDLQWIVDSYTIVFAGLLLTAGSLGDRFGRYRSLAGGLVVFGAGSLISTFATSPNMLIATRALMGIGAAFIMPATLSILTNVFTDNRERAKAIGVWAGVSAIGIGVGPVLGGFLLTHFWWGSVFFVNVPVVIIALTLGYFLIPDSRDESAPRLDPLGSGLSIAGLATLLWAIIEGPTKGWGSTEVVTAFVVAGVIIAAFFVWELRCSSPMLDMRVFKNRRFSAASGAITVTFLTLFGTIFLLTQYFQGVLGYSAMKAGAVLIPQAVAMMVLAPISPRWAHRFGSKAVVAAGMAVVALTLVLMTTFETNSSTLHIVLVTMLLGVGMAHVMPAATESIMGSLPREKAGVGSAMNDTTRQVGGAVGVALLGSILTSRYAPHVTEALSGVAPQSVIDVAKDSLGAALGLARDGLQGQPLSEDVTTAARDGFVSGFHTAVLVAACIVMVAAAGVLRWLPARATDVDDAEGTGLHDFQPQGLGPVDVVPAEAAQDLAEVLGDHDRDDDVDRHHARHTVR